MADRWAEHTAPPHLLHAVPRLSPLGAPDPLADAVARTFALALDWQARAHEAEIVAEQGAESESAALRRVKRERDHWRDRCECMALFAWCMAMGVLVLGALLICAWAVRP